MYVPPIHPSNLTFQFVPPIWRPSNYSIQSISPILHPYICPAICLSVTPSFQLSILLSLHPSPPPTAILPCISLSLEIPSIPPYPLIHPLPLYIHLPSLPPFILPLPPATSSYNPFLPVSLPLSNTPLSLKFVNSIRFFCKPWALGEMFDEKKS
jgi:hypothetical protein